MAQDNQPDKLPQTPESAPVQGGLLAKLAPVKDIPIVQWGFRYAGVVVLICTVLFGFGIFALHQMDKNEFPPFTVREGVLVAVYPGASALEMEQQVLKPLEEYVFSKKEVDKVTTESNATAGMVMIFVELDDNVKDTDTFWNTFTRELENVKASLPAGVLAVRVISNFGDTSSLLITMESKDKTYRELGDYMDDLKDRLRPIESVGELSVYGKQNEQITVRIDPDKLANYGISEKTLGLTLMTQGFNTTGGELRDDDYTSPIYVSPPLNDVADIADQIIFSTPGGDIVRLRDVAEVVREYPEPTSFITNNGVKSIMLSISMKADNNVVKMGEEVERVLTEFEAGLPEDVSLFRITNQPYDVNNSVNDFLRELLIAVVAVIIVIMCLLPFRTALIAAATIPITIFISLALFYVLGIELNTVTLACLIVSLGMIVDNSVVIIDDYVELLGEGMAPKEATLRSASEFYKSIFSATLAISIVFFPFLITMTGMFRDFLSDFPWAMTIILIGSFFIAELLVPFLQYKLIKPKKVANLAATEAALVQGKKPAQRHFSLMGLLQRVYDWLIVWCFRLPWLTIAVSLALTAWGGYVFLERPVQLMPIAERNQFAVEIHLPTGSSLEATNAIADSLERILRADDRVVSVANFHGCSSPRFQTTYAPQVGGPNFAQFIVNTKSNDATIEVLNEYAPKYTDYFPGAYVRFKQLSYSKAAYPIELHIVGDDLDRLTAYSDTVFDLMRSMDQITLAMSTASDQLVATEVEPDYTQLARLGLTNAMLETSLALRFNHTGLPIATVWDGTYAIPVVVKTNTSDRSDVGQLENQQMPAAFGLGHAPLGQFAKVKPKWDYAKICHKDGLREVKLMAQVGRDDNAMAVTHKLMKRLEQTPPPDGISITYGGDYEQFETIVPNIVKAIGMAIVIIFFILLFHYKKVKVSILLLLCMVFSVPGAGFGLLIQDGVFSLTCTLGIISLMGILVRNVIIMIDYAQELQTTDNLPVREAILESAKRRMRPIFLTSAAATMGVLPMVLTGSALWKPMGTVIFWGTMITFFFIVTVIPVIYWKVMQPYGKKAKAAALKALHQSSPANVNPPKAD